MRTKMHGCKRLPGLENQEWRVKDLLWHANFPRPTAATTHTTNTTLRLSELLNSHNNTVLGFIPVLMAPSRVLYLLPIHMYAIYVPCTMYMVHGTWYMYIYEYHIHCTFQPRLSQLWLSEPIDYPNVLVQTAQYCLTYLGYTNSRLFRLRLWHRPSWFG